MRSPRTWVVHGAMTVALAAGILLGCGNETDSEAAEQAHQAERVIPPVTTEVEASGEPTFHASGNPATLEEWGQLVSADGEFGPNAGVTPYELNSALFSDYAHKLRTVWIPDGSSPATYTADEVFEFPVGTVITKTFYYEVAPGSAGADLRVLKNTEAITDLSQPLDLSTVHLVETRVLAHRDTGWVALPYVWNDEQTAATLERVGDLVPMTLVDGTEETPFTYVVPDANQCAGCHATNHTTKEVLPIGPKARHLNLMVDTGEGSHAQLDHWSNLALVTGLPEAADIPAAAVWTDDTASLDARARAYLDINCAHCHNTNGPADTSGLFLESATEVGLRLGVCKGPVAAGTGTGGRRVGIHPGEPDDSIFVFRMETTNPGAMMPELGRALTHHEGVDLIAEWIDQLDGSCS